MAIDTWAKLTELPNPDLRVLIEFNPGKYLPCGTNWTSEGSNTYSHACDEVKVNAVTDDGQECVVKTSKAQVQAQAGSYWFDKANQKIYVHCFDNDDLSNPSTDVVIVMYCWKNFSTDVCEFNGIQYMPLVRRDSLPALDISVDDIVEGIYKFNFGSFSLNNPGWWETAGAEYIWTNRRVLIKLGGEGLPYAEYCTYFVGRVSDYYVGDETSLFTVKDVRVGTFSQLPVNHYWKGTGGGEYPNLSDADHGKPIPIFYGVKEEIVPVCIDPEEGTGGRWKIADGKIKEITEIRWLYDDWEEILTPGTDYTEDLNNGEFVLNMWIDITTESLEVDAKGFVDEESALLTKAGDISLDVLKNHLDFLDDELDLDSFAHASAVRTYECCLYLDADVSSRETLQTLARSVVGFLVPTEDGKLSFEIYEPGTPVGAVALKDADYKRWRVKKDNKFVRNKVRVRYDKSPKEGVHKTVEKTDYSILHKYGMRKTLNLETFLKNKLDAKDVAQGVLGMCAQPVTVVETLVGLKGYGLFPTRKILVTRERAPDMQGKWTEKIFRIRKAAKDSNLESVDIVALDDLESLGEGLCAVCYSCQTCYTAQAPCSVCYTCELCVADQGGCQVCNTCELCVADQGGCQVCNTCQSCNTCQECESCDACNVCESCVVCEPGEPV